MSGLEVQRPVKIVLRVVEIALLIERLGQPHIAPRIVRVLADEPFEMRNRCFATAMREQQLRQLQSRFGIRRIAIDGSGQKILG